MSTRFKNILTLGSQTHKISVKKGAPMSDQDFYANAHLFVAAIRIFEHQQSKPPSVDDIGRMLSFSPEQSSFICRKLKDLEVIEVVDSAFGNKLFIRNHQKIEEIPRGETESRIEAELKKFQNSKNKITNKIESIQAEQAKKKKDLFAELEKNLKKGLDKK
jgi:hypothetical protein